MQYLMNEEEHRQFIANAENVAALNDAKEALAAVRDHMLKQANYTCVHNREGRYVGYCDGCPCSPIDHDNYRAWKLVCGKKQAYGK